MSYFKSSYLKIHFLYLSIPALCFWIAAFLPLWTCLRNSLHSATWRVTWFKYLFENSWTFLLKSRAIFNNQTYVLWVAFLNYSSASCLTLYILVRGVPVLVVLELEQAVFHRVHSRADEFHRGCCRLWSLAAPWRAQKFLGPEPSIIAELGPSLWRTSPNNLLS